jgi:hypothetical protein
MTKTLRRRAYLAEAVKPGAVLDTGVLRIHRGNNYVSVTDLRTAGQKGATVNRFVIYFDETSKSIAPIQKAINWMKRARTYAQALSVGYDALESAEKLSIQNHDRKIPWLEEVTMKGVHVPPSGADLSSHSEMARTKTMGTLKASTRGRVKPSYNAGSEGARPTKKSATVPGLAPSTKTPKSVPDPRKDNVLRFPQMKEYVLVVKGKITGSTVKAPTALKALQVSGYKPDALSDPVLFQVLQELGVKSKDYGPNFAIDIGNRASAFLSSMVDVGAFTPSKSVPKPKNDKPKENKSKTKLSIPKEIMRQLGGNRFVAMTGAKNIAGDRDSLSFRLPKAKGGINYVNIKLTPMDTYKVTFGRITMGAKRGYSNKVKAEYDDIYVDRLRSIFEKETGLRTSL